MDKLQRKVKNLELFNSLASLSLKKIMTIKHKATTTTNNASLFQFKLQNSKKFFKDLIFYRKALKNLVFLSFLRFLKERSKQS